MISIVAEVEQNETKWFDGFHLDVNKVEIIVHISN
jgi:hypothetical protein